MCEREAGQGRGCFARPSEVEKGGSRTEKATGTSRGDLESSLRPARDRKPTGALGWVTQELRCERHSEGARVLWRNWACRVTQPALGDWRKSADGDYAGCGGPRHQSGGVSSRSRKPGGVQRGLSRTQQLTRAQRQVQVPPDHLTLPRPPPQAPALSPPGGCWGPEWAGWGSLHKEDNMVSRTPAAAATAPPSPLRSWSSWSWPSAAASTLTSGPERASPGTQVSVRPESR